MPAEGPLCLLMGRRPKGSRHRGLAAEMTKTTRGPAADLVHVAAGAVSAEAPARPETAHRGAGPDHDRVEGAPDRVPAAGRGPEAAEGDGTTCT